MSPIMQTPDWALWPRNNLQAKLQFGCLHAIRVLSKEYHNLLVKVLVKLCFLFIPCTHAATHVYGNHFTITMDTYSACNRF
jgi:hypothetical protein